MDFFIFINNSSLKKYILNTCKKLSKPPISIFINQETFHHTFFQEKYVETLVYLINMAFLLNFNKVAYNHFFSTRRIKEITSFAK
ncbi:hypothetical protein CWI14_00600 [Streptococcus pneumoniae]|nr:hypothetical protein CWI14_00600 [Streptococcus pneumoniae]